MGYYTNYDLSWDIPDEYPMNEEETADAIANYFGNLPYWRDGGYDFTGSDIFIPEAKWYDYQDDMFMLSRFFPEITFHLWFDGDDWDDKGVEHWENGRYQHCRAEIPPFDPQKMTEYHPDTT